MESFFFSNTSLPNIFSPRNVLINDSTIFSSQLINEEIPLFANINKNTSTVDLPTDPTDPPVEPTDNPTEQTNEIIDLEERIIDLEETVELKEKEKTRLRLKIIQQQQIINKKNKLIREQKQQISNKNKIINQLKQQRQMLAKKRKR